MKYPAATFIGLAFLFHAAALHAQDKRVQYPGALSHAYFSVNIGYLNYPFSNLHLENGYAAEKIIIPHTGVRLTLYGYRFTKNLSAEITYMRPVLWVVYRNVNSELKDHSVWMNIAGLNLKSRLPLSKKLSVYGQGGLTIITRHGFTIDDEPAMKDINYADIAVGGGIDYALNRKWHLQAGMDYTSARSKQKQPHTLALTSGFVYHIQPLSSEQVARKLDPGFIFPRNMVQVAYSTNALGYGVNSFFANKYFPVFWGGSVHVDHGLSLLYQRNIFHSRKTFSLDWGLNLAYWKTKEKKEAFYTASLYPLLRFTFLRSKLTDFYFNYSVAGPTYISKTILDEENTGKHFSFQDFMGLGVFAGPKRKINGEIRIAHYSNGNLFSQNVGVKIPLTFGLGYTF